MEGASLAGGQTIYIKGRGFGQVKDAITVDVDGVPCVVVHVHEHEVECVLAAGNHTVRDVYRGGAGVKVEYSEDLQRMFLNSQWHMHSLIAVLYDSRFQCWCGVRRLPL